MGYFSNGTEGDMFQSMYCERCVHWRQRTTEVDGIESCPIIDIHWMHNYDQCAKDANGKQLTWILGQLIKRTNDGLDNECQMFVEKPDATS